MQWTGSLFHHKKVDVTGWLAAFNSELFLLSPRIFGQGIQVSLKSQMDTAACQEHVSIEAEVDQFDS